LLVLLALLPGCGVFASQGPSQVARGEYYSAGKPEFDSFFIALHDQQVEILAAPQEPGAARANLTEALGLTPDASEESLKQRLAQEVAKLAAQGLRLRLEVPAASAALDASATLFSSESTSSTPLRSALPREATRLVRSRNKMLASKLALEKLNITGITLEGSVEQSFRVDGPWKRDQVRKNLSDSQKVITLMRARAQEVADIDQKLLTLLAEVVSTDPSLGKMPASVPPAPVEDAPKSVRRAPHRASPSSRPSGGAAPPRAAKPASPRDDESAPAPKATQGSAPAEIEP